MQHNKPTQYSFACNLEDVLATTIYCSSHVRDLWPSPLAGRWAAEYPQLFDADDIRLTHRQRKYHFVEWFAAIHLFQRDSTRSLVEKYVFRTHPIKQQLLATLAAPEDLEFLREFRSTIGVQPPDLLLYKDRRLIGFAEVKGPRDRLSDKQVASHAALRRIFAFRWRSSMCGYFRDGAG